jgi:hypothetical protein
VCREIQTFKKALVHQRTSIKRNLSLILGSAIANEVLGHLAESIDEMQITRKLMAEEMKCVYEIMPSEAMEEFYFSDGLTLQHQ